MNESEAEKLIERGLSGGLPRQGFRDQLLADSTTALVRGKRLRSRWRMAGLAVAAVVIAAISFLGGRLSVPHAGTQSPAIVGSEPGQTETVRVPTELVTWLEAARFFKQLGMQERVALAYDRATRLLPYETTVTGGGSGRVLAAAGDVAEEGQADAQCDDDARSAVESIRRIMAQSLGG